MSDATRVQRSVGDRRARADQIEIRGLEVFAHHGVFAHEQREGQRFVLDLVLDVDTHIAARTDNIDDAVDYGAVARDIAGFVRDTRFDLIETLATRVADRLLAIPRVAAAGVRVAKPDVDLGESVDHVAVSIRRSRPTHLS